MTVGSVLGEAWSLYVTFFPRFFVLAAAIFLITNLALATLDTLLDAGTSGGAALLSIVALSVAIVGSYWLQGAFVFAVQDVRDGAFDASTNQIFERVRPHLGTLVVVGTLGGIGIAAGLLMLVVPGLLLLTWWALLAPVVVLEKKGVREAFRRSRTLVRGYGWTVFGVVLIAALLTGIAATVVSALLAFLPPFLETWIGGTIAGAVAAPFGAIAITLLYFQITEGMLSVATKAEFPPARTRI